MRSETSAAAALSAALIAVTAPYDLAKIMNHDVAYFLHAADRTLGGERLYRDIIELNPPSAYWLSAVPAALARLLHTHMVPTFHAWTYAMALFSTALAVAVARRIWTDANDPAPAWVAPPALFALLAMPGTNFGQREHLLAILLLPYLVSATRPRARLSRAASIGIGLMAGAAVALKPYFALYLVLVEGLACARERTWRTLVRPTVVAALVVVALAVVATFVAYPEYAREIVPLGRAIYRGYENPMADVLTRRDSLVALGLAALLVAITVVRHPRTEPVRAFTGVFAAASLAGFAAYVLQRKGWRYQAYPAVAFAALGLSFALIVVAQHASVADARERARSRGGALAGALVVVLAIVYATESWAANHVIAGMVEPLAAIAAREARGRPILFLSSNLPYAFPVVNYSGATWPYHHHHLLPLPGVYLGYDPRATGRPFRRPDEMGPIEKRFFTLEVEDAVRAQPRVIFVDHTPQIPPLDDLKFDLLAYFRQDPRFDRMMTHYHALPRVSGHDVFVRDD